ncbi:MAG: putative dehydrogenase [Flavobacteriales bacterium]|jgi:predicted dehydrogenase
MTRKIRMGMVGGGEGAFIGAVHRLAANLDGQIELVCGAFSSQAEKSRKSGRALYLPDSRCYPSYQAMFEAEALLPLSERMDFVAIVTPNHLHFPVAELALRSGFHVMSDKPATFNLDEALTLRKTVEETGMLYGLTHTYTGYPMVKEAKERVKNGGIGKVRRIIVEYPQGWLATKDNESSKQGAWRVDPSKAGVSCCMGDIGVHAANLAEYISGSKISQMCADLNCAVEGRLLDDDGAVLLRFDSGARGTLIASQVCVGEENALKIRIYGEKAGLEWSQQEPNTLWLKSNEQPTQMLRAGHGALSRLAQANLRTPSGHPEGYLEAFANLYRNFAEQIRARLDGSRASESALDLPGINEAVRGMAFIENVVASSASSDKWLDFPEL